MRAKGDELADPTSQLRLAVAPLLRGVSPSKGGQSHYVSIALRDSRSCSLGCANMKCDCVRQKWRFERARRDSHDRVRRSDRAFGTAMFGLFSPRRKEVQRPAEIPASIRIYVIGD